MKIDLEDLKALISTLDEAGVREFEYEDEAHRVRLSFAGGVPMLAAAPLAAPVAAAAAAPVAASSDEGSAYVTSPFVGTFYRSAAPGSPPFTDVGQAVSKGQTLCIVEAMKLMNEIECDLSGTVLEVLVDNGTSVEFGQKLFKIKKA
jgi:acetyl-CoA carboxylase biotin carboxyl carrier protein